MSREIKFRAWNIKEAIMCNIQTLTNTGAFLVGVKKGEDQILDGGREIITAPTNGRFCYNKEFILQQFTGLKDKNGKDIYEGDVLSTAAILASDKIDDKYFNVEVRWNECGWMANGSLGKYQCRISEVVGNIHETPELLTKN